MSYSKYPTQTRHRGLLGLLAFGLVTFVVGAIVGGVVGVFAFIRITGGTGEASTSISAPTLSVDGVTSTGQAAVIPEGNNTVGAALPTLVPPTSVINPTEIPTSPQPAARRLFRIVSEESEARFSVYETFPEGTAVGRTNQIAGDIIIDFDAPANSQVGTIRVNLRTLRTDDADRDRSIRCCVLLTAQNAYEFSDFAPTSITGMPPQVQVGQTASFQVTGNLTLRGNTRLVTFDVSVTPNSESEIRGTATATVNRTDFGILNDDQNGFDYHGVAEQVTLTFDFVARAVEA